MIDRGIPIVMDATHPAPMPTAQPATVALFISDLHLQASMPHTAEAFFSFLHSHALHASELYLLGDIFEYWAGDDDLTPFNLQVIEAIRAVSDHGVEIFWISGNRDFLVGTTFAKAAGITMVPDPFVANIADQEIVLTHGDALCTDDVGYMTFRAQVRSAEWQKEFLTRPLEQRKAIIAGLRQGSRDAQRDKADYIMDVNVNAVASLFDSTNVAIMIHGHTHRPARHVGASNGEERVRFVLPDWDCDTENQRGGWISISSDAKIERFGLDASALP